MKRPVSTQVILYTPFSDLKEPAKQPIKQAPAPAPVNPSAPRPVSTRALPVTQNPQGSPAPINASNSAPVKSAPVKSGTYFCIFVYPYVLAPVSQTQAPSAFDDVQKSIEDNFNDLFDIINGIPGAHQSTKNTSSDMDDVMSKLESELAELSKH